MRYPFPVLNQSKRVLSKEELRQFSAELRKMNDDELRREYDAWYELMKDPPAPAIAQQMIATLKEIWRRGKCSG